MATTAELTQLKDKLVEKKMPEGDINRVLSYITGAIQDEAAAKRRKPDAKTPVTNNTIDTLYKLTFKYWNLGLILDGVNVVISGNNMAMVTYHGYKNKVLSVYPETQFDIQLMREGDTFHVSKESGSIVYSHEIANPFGNAKIIGAYCIFKNKRGEYLETLNEADFKKMKDASKQSWLWGEWESEFWLKSVIKRACKRHFNDVIAEIDKNDNDDFGILADKPPVPAPDVAEKAAAVVEQLNSCRDNEELNKVYKASGLQNNKEVTAAYKAKREALIASKGTEKSE